MKRYAVALFICHVVVLNGVDGVLDTSFNQTGFVLTNFGGTSDDRAFSITLQVDGKILAGSFSDVSGTDNFALARYLPCGVLDDSFNPGGFLPPLTLGLITTDLGGATDRIRRIVVQLDGKILAAGKTDASGTDDAVLVRYLTTGARDPSFGSGGTPGVVVTNISPGLDDGFQGMTIQPDGKIVCVGIANNNLAVVRYNSDGSLDTTFGIGNTGIRVTDIGGLPEEIYDVVIQPDGKIVACGYSDTTTGFEQILVIRYLADGSLDPTFGIDGIVVTDADTTPAGSASDRGRTVRLQGDGKIVVGGFTGAAGSRDFVVLRYLTDGTLDTSFGTGGTGFVRTDFGGINDRGFGMALQSDGKIVIGGFSNQPGTIHYALARYTIDGELDTTFGSAGTGLEITTAITGTNTRVRELILQNDGKILAGGFADPGGNFNFCIARYSNDSVKLEGGSEKLRSKYRFISLLDEG